jgi:hypothetical protein
MVPKNWIIHLPCQLAMKYRDKFRVLNVSLRLLGKDNILFRWVVMSN